MPKGLSVYNNLRDRNNKNYYLRFKGQNVGKVTEKKGGIELECLVNSETGTHDIKGCPMKYKGKARWRSNEADKFRSYFKGLAPGTKIKSPEHEVENALLKEFHKNKKSEKVLCNIQPVLLYEGFFQMPTPLGASDHDVKNLTYSGQNGGGIDILARIKTSDGHNRLCVIEVKDENKSPESQEAAMSQAIVYATFISKLLTTAKANDWWEFFMGHKKKRARNANTLDKHDIEVVTIMPKGGTKTFENRKCEVVTGPERTCFTLHCHSLYYDPQKFESGNGFEFSGTFIDEIKK